MNEQFSIAGKVAVITGAGGVLGGSIAKCFMQQGAKVVAVDIRQEQLDKRVEELKTYGEDVIGIVGNVLDIASLEKLADDLVAKWGRIDILLNIAGGNMPGATLAPDQHFYDMDISCWEKVTNLNMNGTVYPSLVFSKVMAKQGKGCIVNVSSMAAYSAITRVPGYSAAKTAVANFTQWLATYLAPAGIRVNAVAPGFFVNDRSRKILYTPEGGLSKRGENIMSHTPMGRFGDPKELLGSVLWLLDDEKAGFVTGTTVAVDGGFLAHSGI